MVVKLILYPLLGYFVVRQFLDASNHVVWVLLMLEFSAPPALALGVFSQQYGYKMKIIPAACLISYIFCLITVPFFVALAP
jgi:predicted permease